MPDTIMLSSNSLLKLASSTLRPVSKPLMDVVIFHTWFDRTHKENNWAQLPHCQNLLLFFKTILAIFVLELLRGYHKENRPINYRDLDKGMSLELHSFLEEKYCLYFINPNRMFSDKAACCFQLQNSPDPETAQTPSDFLPPQDKEVHCRLDK